MNSLKSRCIGLLRWSERYTKTDMVYLFEGGFWLGLGQLSNSLVALGVLLLVANTLPADSLGEYRFLISAYLLLNIFSLPGIQTALLQSTPKGYLGNLSKAFSTQMRFGLIASLISGAAAIYYALQGNYGLTLGFSVIAIVLPILESSSSYISFLQSIRSFKSLTLYTTLTRLATLPSIAISALLFPQHAWLVVAAFLGVQAVFTFIFFIRTKKTCTDESSPYDPSLVSYGVHLTLIAALGLFAAQADKVIVWNILGSESLAVFFIASAIPLEIGRFLHLIPTIALPKFSVIDSARALENLAPKLRIYFLFVLGVVSLYVLIAPIVLPFLFPLYAAAVPYSQVFMVGVLASALYPIEAFLRSQRKTTMLYVFSTISPIIYVASAFFLCLFFGIWGVVYAFLVDSLVRSVFLLLFFIRMKKQDASS